MIKKIILLIILLFLINCSEKNPTNSLVLTEPPVITGIHVTADYTAPSDTFYQDYRFPEFIVIEEDVFGVPSYPMEGTLYPEIDVYPNPRILYNSIDNINRFGDHITFCNLPPNVRIEIYKGKYILDESEILNSSRVSAKLYGPTVILKSDGNNQFLNWGFHTDSGHTASSGLYRAYFYTEDEGLINYVDFYIILTNDCDYYIDPTGWIPPFDEICEHRKNGCQYF